MSGPTDQCMPSESFGDLLNKLRTDLVTHIDLKTSGIRDGLNAINVSLSTLNEHIDELETRVSINENNVTNLERRATVLEEGCAKLEKRESRGSRESQSLP